MFGRREVPTSDGGACESDSSFVPISRLGPKAWPSFVIEAGYSQTEESLRLKADWWLRKSNYAVKLVLLVKMEVNRQTIWLEKWKGMPPQPDYHGPIIRSRSAPLPLEPRFEGSRTSCIVISISSNSLGETPLNSTQSVDGVRSSTSLMRAKKSAIPWNWKTKIPNIISLGDS